jgi:hypothetical protein
MVVTGGIPTFVAMKNILFALLVITTALVNAQQLTVSPAQLNFGTVTEISPDSQQVTITNSSNGLPLLYFLWFSCVQYQRWCVYRSGRWISVDLD